MMAAKKAVTEIAPVDHASLNDALLAIQRGMPAFQRESLNPHFGSAYLSLEALLPQVLEVLNANGVLLTQFPTEVDTSGALRTRLTHVASGEYIEDTMMLAAGAETPQKQGSAITYAKRYGIMAILGITADKDDDANAATGRSQSAPAPLAPLPAGLVDTPFPGAL